MEELTKEVGYFNPLSLYRERPFAQKMTPGKKNFNPLSLYRERQSTEML